MQSIWIELLVVIAACAVLNNAVPVNVTEQSDLAKTRIIIPPELPTLHFELLKERSEKDKKQNVSDSTPLAFLRSSEDVLNKSTAVSRLPTIAFEGNKQTPIYITIPIYFNGGYPASSTIGVDTGAIVATDKLPNISEDKPLVLNSSDLQEVLLELLKIPSRQNNRKKNFRGKKRGNELKTFRIYRD